MVVAKQAAGTGKQAADVLVLCSIHRLWLVFYSEPFHWCHHRQL